MKNTWLIGIVGVVAVAVAAAALLGDSGTSDGKSDLSRLSAVSLIDYGGATVSLGSFEGTPLVVNAWAVWCPFCRAELPDFAALQEAFPDDITVIAIDRAESLEKAKGYTDELGISDKMVFLLDPKDDFYKEIGGFSMPETIFVDEAGNIVFHKRGPLTLEEMKSAVVQHLK